MLDAIIRTALNQRLLVLLAAIGLAIWGADAYRKLPIDAFPDVAPIQVMIAMRAPGLTPEELESRVTAPIEIAMRGIPNLASMRSTTRYSVALMTFEFEEGVDIYWARAQVNERLASVGDQMPSGVKGGLAPIVTPLADVLMFTVVGGNLSPTEQRSLVDWTVRPALRSLHGVADVNVIGGFVRTFEVVPSPAAMAARGITAAMLTQAISQNNRNDGAGRLKAGEEVLLVRGEGRLQSLEDIAAVVVVTRPTGVIRVSDVAEVRHGALARNGVVTRDGEGEAVWGVVLGLRGADARTVVEGVKTRLDSLRPQLPAGVNIEIFYDRSDLIGQAVWTVQKVLMEAILLVVLLLVVFIGNLRAALVVSIILPLAALATFGIMRLWGLSANIMSLGGLAIAIGILVDCAVVVVENVEHRFVGVRNADFSTRLHFTLEATREVAVPLASGVAIIIVVFLPLLSLEGLEGRLFSPVALTIAFALMSALTLALTLIPVLSAYMLRPVATDEPWLVRRLGAFYEKTLDAALKRPLHVGAAAVFCLVLTAPVAWSIGQTFMPTMEEGTPVVTVRTPPTTSVEAAAASNLRIQRRILQAMPEVSHVMARAGADELGIDPVGLNEADMFLSLKPRSQWRRNSNDWLNGELRRVLEGFPGATFSFSQPIDMRVQEMIIGARGDVVVKVFGQDIATLNRIAANIAAVLGRIAGAQDVFALENDGARYLSVRVDRLAAGRMGLNATDIQDASRLWIDGQTVGLVLEGAVRTPLLVRGDQIARRSATDFARTPIVTPDGKVVEMSQVAEIRAENGPIQVIREQTQRYGSILANVNGRDLVGFVAEAKAAVARDVGLPSGYTLEWGGQFENQQRAAARLAIVVPVALGLIFLLLYFTFGSVRQAALVFCNVPFAAIGGFLALRLSGEFLSVPASVGFIALIGIAVLNGVVLISYMNKLLVEGARDVRHAVRDGARRRMRPVVLTASIAALGLAPFLFADGPGAEIQRPLAIVVIGGLTTATILTLFLLPILYDRYGVSRETREACEEQPGQSAHAIPVAPAPSRAHA